MPTFLLSWNPNNWREWRSPELQQLKAKLAGGERVRTSWSTGVSKRPSAGDRVYWLRLGLEPKGIFAAGRVASDVWEAEHWDSERAEEGQTRPYVYVDIDELVDPWAEPILSQQQLSHDLPEMNWSPQGSGVQVPPEHEVTLSALWHSFLSRSNVGPIPPVVSPLGIHENLRSFVRELKEGPDDSVELLSQSSYFVYDTVSGQFVPNKWSAFRGMTGETYLALKRLQSEERDRRGFNGGRARQIVENVLGSPYSPDPDLSRKLEDLWRELSHTDTKRDWSSTRFLTLPTAGVRHFWWVNQGKTYKEERDGGYIWAPQRTKAGTSPYYFWENVSLVSPGDIIFHYEGGDVRAVSVATEHGREADRPSELPPIEWDTAGWRADCDYVEIAEPISLVAVQSRLAKLQIEKGPVNHTGRVNQGYLYGISAEAASILAEHLNASELPNEITQALGLMPLANTMKSTEDLNVIYYGPPGTGKTYTTARRAVEIVDGSAPSDRHAVMKRYRELRDSEQVAFVTFHQSYSYEEFVEGIRPVLADSEQKPDAEISEASTVRYECRPGVFRRICERAELVGPKTAPTFALDLTKTKVWKMSLGATWDAEEEWVFEEALAHKRILLGWGGSIDFSGCDTRDAVAARFHEKEEGAPTKEFAIQAVDRFKNMISVGDLVVVSDGNLKFRAIGRITGEYFHIDREDYSQARPVEWLLVPEESRSSDMILKKVFSQATVYEIKPRVLKLEGLRSVLSPEQPTKPRRYVLIIDEINRGNIAKVLGELITLLEPDKRLGAQNELRAVLPYSGSEFGVPANLYVIGTMNTADRSIAFLDTALRRRFRFLEMMPKPAVVRDLVGEGGVIDGVDVAQLLVAINDRIELLYDRDHTLGHAYLLNVTTLDDLRRVFIDRLIPLLQEYFYDDWSKIGLVLGCPFDGARTKNASPILTAQELDADSILGDADDYETKLRFQINPAFTSSSTDTLPQFFNSLVSAHRP